MVRYVFRLILIAMVILVGQASQAQDVMGGDHDVTVLPDLEDYLVIFKCYDEAGSYSKTGEINLLYIDTNQDLKIALANEFGLDPEDDIMVLKYSDQEYSLDDNLDADIDCELANAGIVELFVNDFKIEVV